MDPEIRAQFEETQRHFDVVAEGTRAHVQLVADETRRHFDVVAEGMRVHVQLVADETRRHFDAVADGMRSDVRLVAEGVASLGGCGASKVTARRSDPWPPRARPPSSMVPASP
ncbi:MAG: hypothetical protein HYY64_15035 [Candidatus Rokubacteria bacterium]|nr:hypothetical protein [Candidatus Rokubacteria bacterium]